MTVVLLALGASLAWGVADFVGPYQARTLGTWRVLLWAQIGGLASIAIAVAVVESPPDDPAILLAIPAAVSGMLGLYAYYRGMITGTMSVVAPIAGASAIVPVVFGIATGDRPSAAQICGIVAAHHDARAARTAEAAVLYHANQLDAVAATRPVE